MSEITLVKQTDPGLVPFVVNLQNKDNPEQIETYKYNIRRLGGKAAMQVNLLLAEFSRDKNRDALLGASMMQEILTRTTKQEGTELELLDLFDCVDDAGLEQLAMGMIEAAKSSSVQE